MNNEINLLYSKKQLQLSRLATKARVLRLIALGFLFLVTAFSIILFLLIVASPLPGLRNDEKAITATLTASHELILKQTLLSMRLSDIQNILGNRSRYGEVLGVLRKDLSNGTEINSFSVEKSSVNLTVTSQSLTDLETFFQKLKAHVEGQKNFSSAYLNSLEAVRGSDQRISSFQAKITLTLL